MRITLTGATGLIGRALVPALQRQGHTVVAWVRSAERARARLGADVVLVEDDGTDARLREALTGADAVVNLAGESVLGGRWTARRRAALRTSRVDLTTRVVAAMRALPQAPRVFISGSAVGYYGNQGDRLLREESPAGNDFLAVLCRDWEAAAHAAADLCRVVTLRTGVVLARDGGALPLMTPAFRLGVGGAAGSGRQFMSWIHLHDLVEIIVRALDDDRYAGPINAVAPSAVRATDFAHAVGAALRRPAWAPLPAVVLRAVLGEAAGVLLDSQGAHPGRLLACGFPWRFRTLTAALTDLLRPDASVSIRPVDPARVPVHSYLAARPARYVLFSITTVGAPLSETFPFFAKPENLGLITPSAMQFLITKRPEAIGEHASIDYRIRVSGVPMRWRTRIAAWEPDARFVDVQESGPYRSWYHEHTFRADGARTVMEDRVYYAPPFGLLGRLAHALVIKRMLLGIFQHRQDVIRLRFGVPA
ncbi:MAG: TIGR01777 family oxidoreductase [Vicinamibacterales bacterium]